MPGAGGRVASALRGTRYMQVLGFGLGQDKEGVSSGREPAFDGKDVSEGKLAGVTHDRAAGKLGPRECGLRDDVSLPVVERNETVNWAAYLVCTMRVRSQLLEPPYDCVTVP